MILRVSAIFLFTLGLLSAQIGAFESHADVGVTPKSGDAMFDAATNTYKITGGGANVWDKADAFQFLYKKISGDVTITADVKFLGTGAVGHRKAMLMIRQSLDPGSPYADIAREERSDLNGPSHIRIQRRGDILLIYAGDQLW